MNRYFCVHGVGRRGYEKLLERKGSQEQVRRKGGDMEI